MAPRKREIGNDREWLVKHLRPLIEMGRHIESLDATLPAAPPTYDKGYWTGLKLISIRYYMPGYLNILAPRKRVAYVDLFAGPGLNRIGDARIPVPGSPLLPWAMAGTSHQFNSIILCEIRHDYSEALRTRIANYDTSDRVFIHEGDANEFVRELPAILRRKQIEHSLVVVDQEGLQFNFDSLNTLLDEIKCDLIINLQSTGLTRNLETRDPETAATVRRFLGLDDTDSLPRDENELIRLYRDQLAALDKDVSTEIVVQSGEGPYHYHLIPAVRSTIGGSKWFRMWQKPRAIMERLGGSVLGIVASQIEGKLETLDHYT